MRNYKKCPEGRKSATGRVSKRNRTTGGNSEQRDGDKINELLRACLEKVCELQQDLARQEDFEHDPQAAGYAACAIETMKFLANEGLSRDHPMVKVLSEKLSGDTSSR